MKRLIFLCTIQNFRNVFQPMVLRNLPLYGHWFHGLYKVLKEKRQIYSNGSRDPISTEKITLQGQNYLTSTDLYMIHTLWKSKVLPNDLFSLNILNFFHFWMYFKWCICIAWIRLFMFYRLSIQEQVHPSKKIQKQVRIAESWSVHTIIIYSFHIIQWSWNNFVSHISHLVQDEWLLK